MKKIAEGVYTYKGVRVERYCGNGAYFANVYVNDYELPITVSGITQSAFKKVFNEVIKEYGGLKK